ncbi:MAG: hypothetical protein MMC33_005187 [Icmadophila ericetorum]|nr:hypothetical protein [Icmadophila ericetorum]
MTVGADDPRCAWQRFAQMLHTDGTAEGGDGAQSQKPLRYTTPPRACDERVTIASVRYQEKPLTKAMSPTSHRRVQLGTQHTSAGGRRSLPPQDLPPHQRFSFMATPRPDTEHFDHFNDNRITIIDESPMGSPDLGSQQHQQEQGYGNDGRMQSISSYAEEKGPSRTSSPYNFPLPQQVHPANFAPYADTGELTQPRSNSIPYQMSTLPPRQPLSPIAAQSNNRPQTAWPTQLHIPTPDDPVKQPLQSEIKTPQTPKTPTYNPHSFAGPNVDFANHIPGQVFHPNSVVEPEWKRGLCEFDTTCCTGIFCPCMVYGKTQYRLAQKAKKREATDLLGYESCNGSCTLMTLACGFQWILAAIQTTRIRKAYQIQGSVGSDCIKGLCCCCCVLMQDEREVRHREELFRRHAGPASGGYTNPEPMTYPK